MSGINAGVVIVNTFCGPDDKYFSGYISYIDRPEAVRKKHIEEYDIFAGYMDYMGNPRKQAEAIEFETPERISGLFTYDADSLTPAEIGALKKKYQTAQENESLMWQTVISFDNEWLEKMGVYDSGHRVLDEKRMKNAARHAINTMLEKENLGNAIWSASIHYNTDNIHVHVSTVEPVPMRRRKVFDQYEVTQINGKWQYRRELNESTGEMERIPILDVDGNIKKKEEYVGIIKESSTKDAKSVINKELTQDRELNIQINQIIRERIVRNAREHDLYHDRDFRERFLELYQKLPKNKGVCNYDNNAMKPLLSEIDAMTDLFIQKYHQEDFASLQAKLALQESRYRTAYGDGDNQFALKRMKDLYYRMGNAILNELKAYDKRIRQPEQDQKEEWAGASNQTEFEVESPDEEDISADYIQEPEGDHPEDDLRYADGYEDKQGNVPRKAAEEKGARFHFSWDKYRDAKKLIYTEKEYDKAKEILEPLSEKKNVLAIFELGDMYLFGRGVEENEETADAYFKTALEGFLCVKEHCRNLQEGEKDFTGYCAYRIGKQYLYGQGTERDYEQAAVYLKEASDDYKNPYAMYLLGNLYFQGNGVEKDIDKAIGYYEEASELDNPFAQYKMGNLCEKGEVVELDAARSYDYYESALTAFLKIEDKDDNMLYRIGTMYMKGRGTAVDEATAAKYLEKAAELKNAMAMYQLGNLKLEHREDEGSVECAIDYYKASAELDNHYAQYKLGQIYEAGELVDGDPESSYRYYESALTAFLEADDKDDSRLYRIGSMYLKGKGTPVDYEKAVLFFEQAAELGNAMAMYQLGNLYMAGKSVGQDIDKALYYYKESADQGNPYAEYKLGQIYEKGEVAENNPDLAYSYYKNALEKFILSKDKNGFLLYRIGSMYLKGQGTEIDYDRALKYLKESAAQGNPMAMYQLGNVYLQGKGVEKDEETAVAYYKRAAEADNPYAQYKLGQIYEEDNTSASFAYYEKALQNFLEAEEKDGGMLYRIGMMYLKGRGTQADNNEAVKYLEQSADQKNAMAMYQLGSLFLQGEGIAKDEERALRYLKAAADLDNPYALYKLGQLFDSDELQQADKGASYKYYERALRLFLEVKEKDDALLYRIGNMYLKGLGTIIDNDSALSYLKESAECGNAMAMYRLGNIFLEGKVTACDIEKSLKCNCAAAMLDNPFAQYKLGKLYESGDVIRKDTDKSYLYFEKALKNYLAMGEKNSDVLYRIGSMYLKGQGTGTDYEEALKYLTRSADQKNTMAMYQLGKLFTEYPDDDVLYSRGMKYLLEAAGEDNEYAQYRLGVLMARNGDKEAAAQWFAKSALNGNLYAVQALYRLNAEEKNPESGRLSRIHQKNRYELMKAMRWLRKSMEDEYEKYINMQEYEELQQKIRYNKDIEME